MVAINTFSGSASPIWALAIFFQAEAGIRVGHVTGVQTCALPILWLLDERGWGDYTRRIGSEPLEETFTPFVFAERLKGTRAAIKKAIMDQRRVAGVGNIYANEIGRASCRERG